MAKKSIPKPPPVATTAESDSDSPLSLSRPGTDRYYDDAWHDTGLCAAVSIRMARLDRTMFAALAVAELLRRDHMHTESADASGIDYKPLGITTIMGLDETLCLLLEDAQENLELVRECERPFEVQS